MAHANPPELQHSAPRIDSPAAVGLFQEQWTVMRTGTGAWASQFAWPCRFFAKSRGAQRGSARLVRILGTPHERVARLVRILNDDLARLANFGTPLRLVMGMPSEETRCRPR